MRIGRTVVSIIFGLIIGILACFSRGSVFFILLALVTVYFIKRLPEERERNFILRIFLFGFGLRVLFVLLTVALAVYRGNIVDYHAAYQNPDCVISYATPDLFDDSAYYTLRALYTSLYWKGVPLGMWTLEHVVANREYGFSGFVWLPATFFTLFGFSPVSSRFINCFLGIITALLVYFTVKNTFGGRTARLAAILTAFFPSLFIWSITNLKDTSFIFAFYLMLWAIVKMRSSRSIFYAFIIFIAIWFQSFVRFFKFKEYLYLNILIITLYFLPFLISFLRGRLKNIVIAMMVVSCVFFIVQKRESIGYKFNSMANEAFEWHKGVIAGGGSNYKLLPDRILQRNEIGRMDFLRMYFSGVFHAMFEPVPSRINKPVLVLAALQMCLWYILIILAAAGLFFSLRQSMATSLMLFAYFFVMLSISAVTGGNIGTIFRMRDIITPIILIFASLAFIRIKDKIYGLRS